MNQEGCTYEQALNVIDILNKIPELRNKIYISGGLVPWIMTGENSRRRHHELDILADIKNMELIRDTLIISDISIERKNDSRYIPKIDQDYGFTCQIDGVIVTFYPFKITFENDIPSITINSYRPYLIDEEDHGLKRIELNGLALGDLFTSTKLPNGNNIKILRPEAYLVHLTTDAINGGLNVDNHVPPGEEHQRTLMQLQKIDNLDMSVVVKIQASREKNFTITDDGDKTLPKQRIKTTAGTKIGSGIGVARGFADALILAFITGIAGGISLFVLLNYIKK